MTELTDLRGDNTVYRTTAGESRCVHSETADDCKGYWLLQANKDIRNTYKTGIFSINTLAHLVKFLHFAETPNMIKQNQKQFGTLLLPYHPDGKPPPLIIDNYISQHWCVCVCVCVYEGPPQYNADINSYDFYRLPYAIWQKIRHWQWQIQFLLINVLLTWTRHFSEHYGHVPPKYHNQPAISLWIWWSSMHSNAITKRNSSNKLSSWQLETVPRCCTYEAGLNVCNWLQIRTADHVSSNDDNALKEGKNDWQRL
jgi:hypothetical protein